MGFMAFKVSVITITPEAWPGALGVSLLESARKEGVWELDTIDIRDFGHGKHRQIDDTAAGGGAGMVIKPDVAVAAVNAADAKNRPIIFLCFYILYR